MARKKIKKKSEISTVGNKNNEFLDNLFTLAKSNNDIYDGCIDYIYFSALKTEPLIYYNLHEDEMYSDKDKRLAQRNYKKFFSNNNFSKTIILEINQIIEYVRKEAIKMKYIEQIFNEYYIEKSIHYDADFINKCIFKYYKELSA